MPIDNIILLIIAGLAFIAPDVFGLKKALTSMKEGIPYKQWDENLNRYVEKISYKVKFWQTDAGKIYLIAKGLCTVISIAITLWVFDVFA